MNYGEAITQAFADHPVPPAPMDLEAALTRGIDKITKDAPPWGNDGAHVTDLSGLCDREVWNRRSMAIQGIDPAPFETETQLGFDLGHLSEKILLDRIEAGLPAGWSMIRQQVVRLTLDPEGKLFGTTLLLTDTVLPEWAKKVAADRWIVGHLDAVIVEGAVYRAVVDVKSTVWWSKNDGGRQVWYPKGPPKQGHKIQIAAYSLALDLPVAGHYEFDLASKQRRPTWFTVEPYRALIERRMAAVLHFTEPRNEEPDVLPNDWTYIRAERNSAGRITGGDSWACGYLNHKGEVKKGYCSHTACPRHVSNTEVTL